jgi:DNA-binding CsgD family transcriptional regulator
MRNGITADRAGHLIGLIYDCVLAPDRWVETLHAIRSDLSFFQALLSLWRAPAVVPVARNRWFSAGLDETWIERLPQYGPEMQDYWGGINVVQSIPLGEPQVASQWKGLRKASTNRFVEEWLAPQSIIDLVACGVLRRPGALGSIVFTRHEEAGPVTEAEVAALRLLGPHFRRAVEIGNLLDMKTIEAATFASAFEALSAGLVLADREARVVHANAAARAMLNAAEPIRLVHGRLTLPTPLASNALVDAIARSAGNLAHLGQRGISIPARMKDGRPCVTHVLPLRGGEARWEFEQGAIAAVFIARAETAPEMPAAALALMYDVTPAETRVLELVVEGRALKEIAEKLGVSITTVRTHLARLFHKTGTSRQAELVALIGRMMPSVL